jgi:hypothetical protein
MKIALVAAAALLSLPVLAQTEVPGTEVAAKLEQLDSPEANAAKDVLSKYLAAVKAKKWAEAKKFVHPSALKAAEERKKRLGREDHPMAPQGVEKTDHYLTDFKIVGARVGPLGTIVLETREDNFQVAEKGLSQADMAAYLLGRKDGTWVVADKKRGETFPDASVKLAYKGYFDPIQRGD